MIKKPINSIKNANLGKWVRMITSSALFRLLGLSIAGAHKSNPQTAETMQNKTDRPRNGHLTGPVHTSPGSRRMHPGHREDPAGRSLDIFRLSGASRWAVTGPLPAIGNASPGKRRTSPDHREHPTGRSPDISRAFASRPLPDGASCTSFIIHYKINRL
jgi:hypothetical protein